MGDGRVDSVFGDVTLYTKIVIAVSLVLRQRPPFSFHLAGRLPGTGNHLAHPSHSLGVGAHHAENAHILENVLRGNGLRADPGIGKGHILRNPFVQMMADHQHVQVLVQGVHRVGHGRVGGRGQDIGGCRRPDNVRGMAAAGPLCVVGVDGAPADGGQGVLHAAPLIEGVCVDGHLHIVLVCHLQAMVNGGGCASPVLMELQPHGARPDLLHQGLLVRAVALAQQADVHGIFLGCLQHHLQVPGAGRTGGGVGAVCRAGAASDHGGDAAVQGTVHLLGGDKVDMGVQPSGGENQPFSRQCLRGGAYGHPRGLRHP